MITLHRTDPARNMRRFYHLHIERTLFGDWALIREWGRIGCGGQRFEQWFDTAEAADRALQDLETRKRRRGYETRVAASSSPDNRASPILHRQGRGHPPTSKPPSLLPIPDPFADDLVCV